MVNVGVNVPYIESFGKNYSLLKKEGAGNFKNGGLIGFGSDGLASLQTDEKIRLPLGLGIMWPSWYLVCLKTAKICDTQSLLTRVGPYYRYKRSYNLYEWPYKWGN